ncbi:hypothetical protein ACWD4G_19595 [Streptomyces sp. NPDC002643]
MNLLPRLLELLRTPLFGWPVSGHRVPDEGLAPTPDLPVNNPSPSMLRAYLAAARHRRAPHLWPLPEPPIPLADAFALNLVRAYVTAEDAGTRRPASPARRAW